MGNQFYFLSNNILSPGCGIYSLGDGESISGIQLDALEGEVGFIPSAIWILVKSGGTATAQIETQQDPIYLGPGDSFKLILGQEQLLYTLSATGPVTVICYQ